MNRERIAPQDLVSAMHKVGITELWDVEWAILEADGRIAIVPRQHAGEPFVLMTPRCMRAREGLRRYCCAGVLLVSNPQSVALSVF